MADETNKTVPFGQKPPTKTVGADLMEGASRARNNRGFEAASAKLRQTFNPNNIREMDTAAYQHLDHNVYARVLDPKGNDTGQLEIKYFAGEHVSNIDLAYIEKLEADKDVQEQGNKALSEAGYLTHAEEPDVDAEVLA